MPTDAVHDVIVSDLNLISLVLHELQQDQIWLAGQPSPDVLILCYIRAGRPVHLKTELALRVSAAWHKAVETPEDSIEVAVIEAPAAQAARGGRRLRTAFCCCLSYGSISLNVAADPVRCTWWLRNTGIRPRKDSIGVLTDMSGPYADMAGRGSRRTS